VVSEPYTHKTLGGGDRYVYGEEEGEAGQEERENRRVVA